MNGRIWRKEELDYLIANYADSKTESIALHLGRPMSGVYGKANTMGLKKSEAFLSSAASGRLGKHHQSEKTRFKKGQKPWNKGMKGLQIGGKETQFTKGHLPHNTKFDGATSIRHKQGDPPYEYIRVGKANWVLHHRYRWEQEVGPIPKGHMLRCKDGNTLNTDPANWYLLDMKKNMDMNSGPLHLSDTYVAATLSVRQPELRKELLKHPEVIEAARLNIKLKRIINKKSNEK